MTREVRYQPLTTERAPKHYACWTNHERTGFRDAVNPSIWDEETAALARWEAHRDIEARRGSS